MCITLSLIYAVVKVELCRTFYIIARHKSLKYLAYRMIIQSTQRQCFNMAISDSHVIELVR